MKRVTRKGAAFLPRLYTELIAAIPALAPALGPGGIMQASVLVEGDGTNIYLTVPDTVSDAALDAVIAAHNPTPPAPPLTAKQVAKAALQAASTLADFRAALVAYFQSE